MNIFNLSIDCSLNNKGLCSFGNFKNIFTVTVLFKMSVVFLRT